MWPIPSSEIEQELSPGERLVWSGQPRPGIRFKAADAFAIPFSVFWCGFAIVWETLVLTAVIKAKEAGPLSLIFPLFGLPFVLIGLYLVFGRFLVDARVRQHTFYGITSERIVIVSGLFGRQIKSLNLNALGDLSLTERPDHSGTITFGPLTPFGQWFIPSSWPGAGRFQPPAFEMIERAKEVYHLIRQTQKSTT